MAKKAGKKNAKRGSDKPLVFEFMQKRSAASRKGWERQWESGKRIGKKGGAYLDDKYSQYDIEAPIVEFGDEFET